MVYKQPTFERIETAERTREIRVGIRGTVATVCVIATKRGDDPWQPPGVRIPQGMLSYDMWSDLREAVEKAFAEYVEAYEHEKPPLTVVED